MSDPIVIKHAELSECGRYRYFLTRWWGIGEQVKVADTLVWVMCNPSTADASIDDATVKICMAIARHHRFDGIAIVNLFAYRARDPKALSTADVPLNDETASLFLRGVLHSFPSVVYAWGDAGQKAPGFAEAKASVEAYREGNPAMYLSLNASGNPRHPLYAKADAPLLQWRDIHG